MRDWEIVIDAPIRTRDPTPHLRVVKWDYSGDPHLPVIEVSFAEPLRETV